MSRWLRALRHRRMQRLWQAMHRVSLIGMNYWSSELAETGELDALAMLAVRLGEGPTIFDVGANVGDYSLACVAAFGKGCVIHAFEPSADTFERLQMRLIRSNAVLHPLALSDGEGEAVLHSSEPGSSIASLVALNRPVRPFDPALDERVTLTTIDRFCERQGIERIDLLKLDIEGHELSALRGAAGMIAQGRIRAIQFEFGENNLSAGSRMQDFVAMLPDFDLYRIVPGGPVRWSYAGGRSEIFATMNFLALGRDVRI